MSQVSVKLMYHERVTDEMRNIGKNIFRKMGLKPIRILTTFDDAAKTEEGIFPEGIALYTFNKGSSLPPNEKLAKTLGRALNFKNLEIINNGHGESIFK